MQRSRAKAAGFRRCVLLERRREERRMHVVREGTVAFLLSLAPPFWLSSSLALCLDSTVGSSRSKTEEERVRCIRPLAL